MALVKDILKELYFSFQGVKFRLLEEPIIQEVQDRVVSQIRQRGNARVLFFASNLPMWEYQGLYDLLSNDSRFETKIVLVGFKNSTKEQNDSELFPLIEFFNKRGIEYTLASDDPSCRWIHNFDPDILFYPQPYDGIYQDSLSAKSFYNKLLAYTPYCIWGDKRRFGFNEDFHNHAWRLYYADKCNELLGRRLSYSKGRGIVVTGYPKADLFLDHTRIVSNPWKEQERDKVRVIWAPHYSINPKTSLSYQSHFLALADDLVALTKQYKDVAQFAFKPHPRLYRELCNADNWNEDKANAYYNFWENGENTQLALSDYEDLFLTSDALVHDSGSFTMEYLYTLQPTMFITSDVKKRKHDLNSTGKEALDCHYIGESIDDIRSFIEMVLRKENDPLLEKRKAYYNNHLLPPNGNSVAENMYNDMVISLFK